MNCNVLINKTILIYVISVLNFLSLEPTSHKKDNPACVILSRQHVSQTVEQYFFKVAKTVPKQIILELKAGKHDLKLQ